MLKSIISNLVLWIVLFASCYLFYVSRYNLIPPKLFNYNIFAYGSVFLIGCCVYFGLRFALNKIKIKNFIFIKKSYIIYPILLVSFFSFLFLIYKNEVIVNCYGLELHDVLIRQAILSNWYYILFSIGFTFIIYKLYTKVIIYPPSFQKLKVVFTCFLLMLASVCLLAPNMFINPHWGVTHIHAYTNSIINIYYGIPFSDTNYSIYGHYALFYLPFLKLFGTDVYCLAIPIAFFGFLIYLGAFYIVWNLIKNDILYCITCMAIIALGLTYFSSGIYYQIVPHRLLFPILTLGYLTSSMKNRRFFLHIVIQVVLGILSIIWNLEAGLSCCAIIMCYYLVRVVIEYRDKSIFSYHTLFFIALYPVICFIMAYFIVNLYNLYVGGSWNSIKTFIIPFLSADYNISTMLRTSLPLPISAAFLQLLIFITAFCNLSYNIYSKKNSASFFRKEVILLLVSLSGLCSLTYHINRAAAVTVAVSHIQFIIILAYYSERIISLPISIFQKELWHRHGRSMFLFGLSGICFYLLSWAALEGLFSIVPSVRARYSSVWEVRSLRQDIKNFRNWVNKDVLAFGVGIPEFYLFSGIQPKIHISDCYLFDMNKVTSQLLAKKINSVNELIVPTYVREFRDEIDKLLNDDFIPYRSFNAANFPITHYVRKNKKPAPHSGWDAPNLPHIWTVGKESTCCFTIAHRNNNKINLKAVSPYLSDLLKIVNGFLVDGITFEKGKTLTLTITGYPYLGKSLQKQIVTVKANGEEIAQWNMSKKDTYTATVPAQCLTADKLELKFLISDPRSPKDDGLGEDSRLLGFNLLWLDLKQEK